MSDYMINDVAITAAEKKAAKRTNTRAVVAYAAKLDAVQVEHEKNSPEWRKLYKEYIERKFPALVSCDCSKEVLLGYYAAVENRIGALIIEGGPESQYELDFLTEIEQRISSMVMGAEMHKNGWEMTLDKVDNVVRWERKRED